MVVNKGRKKSTHIDINRKCLFDNNYFLFLVNYLLLIPSRGNLAIIFIYNCCERGL